MLNFDSLFQFFLLVFQVPMLALTGFAFALIAVLWIADRFSAAFGR